MPGRRGLLRVAATVLLAVVCLRPDAVAPIRGEPAIAEHWRDVSAETGAAAVGGLQQFDLVDAPDGTLYLYGGGAGGRPLDDLWRLPVGGQWQRVDPGSGAAPPPLIEPHLAVDRSGRLYELGGLRGDGALVGDLYRYEAGRGWTDLTPTIEGPRPPARQDHGFAYDPDGDDLYVFGGDGGRLGRLNDFWRFEIEANRWVDLTERSGALAIQPRELYDLTDDGHGHLYLFGGTIDGGDGYSRRLNDFWRYDLATGLWEDLTRASDSATVPARHYYGQAADGDGNFYVLGGYITPESGAEAGEAAGDFWVYRAASGTWGNLTPLAAPLLPRIPYAMVREPETGGLALFGGVRPDAVVAAPSDFWRWEPQPDRAAFELHPGRVGADGGEVRTAGGDLALGIPVGALAAEREVGLAWTSTVPVPDQLTLASFTVTLDGDQGASLVRRADLRVRLDLVRDGPMSRYSTLYRRGPNGDWSPVPDARVQSDGRTIAARVLAAGTYAVVGRPFPGILLPVIAAGPGGATRR